MELVATPPTAAPVAPPTTAPCPVVQADTASDPATSIPAIVSFRAIRTSMLISAIRVDATVKMEGEEEVPKNGRSGRGRPDGIPPRVAITVRLALAPHRGPGGRPPLPSTRTGAAFVDLRNKLQSLPFAACAVRLEFEMHHHHHHNRNAERGSGMGTFGVLAAATVAVAAAGYFVGRRWTSGSAVDPEDAPLKALRGAEGAYGEGRITGRTVTIARPRNEVYERWRDFERFPDFMENVTRVEPLADGSARWTVKAPAGAEANFTTRIVEDKPGEVIAWRSMEDDAIRTSGRVEFREAPGDRGTQVDLTLAYDPPGGRVGELVALLFRREPAVQARRDLKRFKQLVEAGEVAVARNLPIRDAS